MYTTTKNISLDATMISLPSNEYQLANKYILSYFFESICISDSTNNFADCALNPVETDIVFHLNRLHYIDMVWKTIKDEYAVSDTDIEAKALFESYTAKLLEKGILVLGEQTRPILGAPGTCYPIRATIELTNKCNFECTHCYKEAGRKCDHFIDADLALHASEALRGNTWLVEFTGGEAPLHPDFERFVSQVDFQSIALFTTGAVLDRLPSGVLKNIYFI